MRSTCLHTLVLMAVAGCLLGQQPKSQLKSQPKPGTTAGGLFLGKSGKPMAGARLILSAVDDDQDKIKLLPDVPTATADPTGRFAFQGFAPGAYTIIYMPAKTNAAIANEIDISALRAVDKSIAPLMIKMELGADQAFKARPWGQFTLLQGHTFWSTGEKMRVWNATMRRGQQGPYLEVRRGRIWRMDFADKAAIKFDAWSY